MGRLTSSLIYHLHHRRQSTGRDELSFGTEGHFLCCGAREARWGSPSFVQTGSIWCLNSDKDCSSTGEDCSIRKQILCLGREWGSAGAVVSLVPTPAAGAAHQAAREPPSQSNLPTPSSDSCGWAERAILLCPRGGYIPPSSQGIWRSGSSQGSLWREPGFSLFTPKSQFWFSWLKCFWLIKTLLQLPLTSFGCLTSISKWPNEHYSDFLTLPVSHTQLKRMSFYCIWEKTRPLLRRFSDNYTACQGCPIQRNTWDTDCFLGRSS